MNKSIVAIFIALVLIPTALALEISIEQPEAQDYNTTTVAFNGSTDNVSDSITYILDNNGAVVDLCTNCSEFSGNLVNLIEGNHSFKITAVLGNETVEETVEFSVTLPVEEPKLEITIISPESESYNTTDVEVTTNIETNLYYQLDNENETLACENCTEFEDTLLNLSEGNHALRFFSGNTSEEVDFVIELAEVEEPEEPEELEITIHSPEDKFYTEDEVLFNVSTNIETDLYYQLDSNNETLACENCTGFTETLVNLSEGVHIVTVFSGNISAEIDFEINTTIPENDDNETDDNETDNGNETYGEPKYDIGFNKLPQALENGEITNEELRNILRENKLNPGILNRVSKTGLLDNETLDLIIETQFTPKGIWQKLFGWIIVDNDDVARSLFEEYDLDEDQQSELLSNTKALGKGTVKKITNQYKIQEKAINRVVESWDDDGVTETVIQSQTLAKNNIDKIIAKGLEKKEAQKLVQNQVLDEEQQEAVKKQWGNDKDVGRALDKVNPGKASAPGQNKITGNAAKSNGRNK